MSGGGEVRGEWGGDWRGQIGRLELDLVELVSGGGGGGPRGVCVCVWGGGGLEAADRPARAGPGGVVSGGGEVRGEWGGDWRRQIGRLELDLVEW